ncbi:Flagellar biosynthetic protein FliR [Austwickia sp. TVS 96-490-7B]|uniref:flagellar biosynthetic protein FliR n=1 Tax=Austwickia sp. TVS 96-490-7B TaxID=2830843 RepID=UPI001C568589|nr:flagellar biosynthetic protein FliR [Austwickia sp. TVS 96-490-7B]MBW3083912.1 Flagellar biosynthetic protein FliR [Austwickia sp. TVS 96-490-7B]
MTFPTGVDGPLSGVLTPGSDLPSLAASGGVNINAPYDLLVTFLLIMGRILAFLVIAPPFAGRSVPMRVKGSLAAAMAVPVTPMLAGAAPTTDMAVLVTAVLYHLATGALMGFMVLLLFSAIQAAGDLIDLFSMFTMSQLLDPLSNTQSGVFGRIEYLVATTMLFASGGHLLLLRGLVGSFQIAPIHPPALGDGVRRLVDGLSGFLVSALEISGPVVLALVLADIALGLVSRAVPSLNIFQLAFPVKTVLTVSLAGVAVSLLPGAVATIVDHAMSHMGPLSKLLGG